MKTGITLGLVCWALVVGFVRAEDAPKTPAKAAAGTPKIKFDSTVYDFGKTSQVEKVTGTFIFHNAGDGVLKLEKPTTSCGCTVAGVKPDVLQPGEKGELTFSLNLPHNKATLQKQITVTCNDPQNPRTLLTVKAEYLPLYDIMPSFFNLTIHKGDTTNLTARVTRTDGKKYSISKLQPAQTNAQSWLQAKAEPEANSTNGTELITVTLKPEGSPRWFTEVLNGYVDGSEQSAFSLTVYGKIVGDITLSKELVYWPITDRAKAVTTQTVTLRSSLAEKLEVKNVTTTLKDLTVEAVPKDDKTVEIVAKLETVPEKSVSGMIHIETNVGSQPKVDLPVNISIIPRPVAPPAATALPKPVSPAASTAAK